LPVPAAATFGTAAQFTGTGATSRNLAAAADRNHAPLAARRRQPTNNPPVAAL